MMNCLEGGARYKIAKTEMGVCITGLPEHLAGEWVAQIQAEIRALKEKVK